ncbi:hypothetical protein FA950_29050 [Bacillus thuringiensis]|uniref:hypothetical protein n=1 Tax=Bacillus thuringiensis TaxID=1428 RepID=UPI0010AD2E80|nr:hypothetical protein [Bacillus thuringiensis]MBV6681501.1 hypothetical protein [Bacillus thuringiensis]TKA00025.1 hypothetical protein FA950_29050 [Bacillus thuringiensis]HDX9530420.1 hypothetical protein [Bacillus thuringiensis]
MKWIYKYGEPIIIFNFFVSLFIYYQFQQNIWLIFFLTINFFFSLFLVLHNRRYTYLQNKSQNIHSPQKRNLNEKNT